VVYCMVLVPRMKRPWALSPLFQRHVLLFGTMLWSLTIRARGSSCSKIKQSLGSTVRSLHARGSSTNVTNANGQLSPPHLGVATQFWHSDLMMRYYGT
jgi:hypothetical protein